MSADLALVFGPERMRPEAREEVISLIAGLPLPWVTRRQVLARWARTVGAALAPEDFERAGPAHGAFGRTRAKAELRANPRSPADFGE